LLYDKNIYKRKANWISHTFRRNSLLKHVIEGKKEDSTNVRGKRGGRRKHIMDNLKESRGYWELKWGSTITDSSENWDWKRLRSCHKADYGLNE
jgi:hypothetical protein